MRMKQGLPPICANSRTLRSYLCVFSALKNVIPPLKRERKSELHCLGNASCQYCTFTDIQSDMLCRSSCTDYGLYVHLNS